MKASNFSDAQKAFILKQGADGIPVADICRKAGISQATYFNWKKKYDGLLPTEMRRLKLLEDENAKLRKLVADLSLDREMLQEIVSRRVVYQRRYWAALNCLSGCQCWQADERIIAERRDGFQRHVAGHVALPIRPAVRAAGHRSAGLPRLRRWGRCRRRRLRRLISWFRQLDRVGAV